MFSINMVYTIHNVLNPLNSSGVETLRSKYMEKMGFIPVDATVGSTSMRPMRAIESRENSKSVINHGQFQRFYRWY